MIKLSINLNKIALIRNAREGDFPNLAEHAQRCVDYGADGLTVHPRPDQRHIRADDIGVLSTLSQNNNVEFNIEGNPFAAAHSSNRDDVGDYPGFMPLVLNAKPQQCTLVPDNNQQLTSDHGFDLKRDGDKLMPIIEQCHRANIRVSLFMDPDVEQIPLAAAIGADRIELYTGPFAEHYKREPDELSVFKQYCAAAECALEHGLGVNAGHDLNLQNLPTFRELPGLQEVSIGHAFVVDALDAGLKTATAEYLTALGR